MARSFLFVVTVISFAAAPVEAQQAKRAKKAAPAVTVTYPPELPGGAARGEIASQELLQRPATLREDVTVAKEPPRVEFLYYPGQDYPGNPWSNWGDGLAVNGKYYSAIGDHLAVNSKDTSHGTGTAFVYEYDPKTGALRELVNTARLLHLPSGTYTPGKIHTQLGLGSDGWLYFATHRGSTRATADAFHYEGDWLLRCHPESGKSEVVAKGPVPRHAMPTGILDPVRLIYYGSTAPGEDSPEQAIQFFAYDLKAKKMLRTVTDGPSRAIILAQSTGRVYYTPGKDGKSEGSLLRFDPAVDAPPQPIDARIGLRAATTETKDGIVYTVSQAERGGDSVLYAFDTKSERATRIGTANVGTQSYVASLDIDPTGRYLYYVPGAHGGGEQDGSPIVQFDLRAGTKKILAFLHPAFEKTFGCVPKGTYSTAINEAGDTLYVTWNISRGSRAWDCCGLTVVHIPKSERE